MRSSFSNAFLLRPATISIRNRCPSVESDPRNLHQRVPTLRNAFARFFPAAGWRLFIGQPVSADDAIKEERKKITHTHTHTHIHTQSVVSRKRSAKESSAKHFSQGSDRFTLKTGRYTKHIDSTSTIRETKLPHSKIAGKIPLKQCTLLHRPLPWNMSKEQTGGRRIVLWMCSG